MTEEDLPHAERTRIHTVKFSFRDQAKPSPALPLIEMMIRLQIGSLFRQLQTGQFPSLMLSGRSNYSPPSLGFVTRRHAYPTLHAYNQTFPFIAFCSILGAISGMRNRDGYIIVKIFLPSCFSILLLATPPCIALPIDQAQSDRPGIIPDFSGDCPPSHPIKGNFTTYSGEECIYHMPGQRYYEKMKAERCYESETDAQADGCRRSKV
jgi:hypothetical protein